MLLKKDVSLRVMMNMADCYLCGKDSCVHVYVQCLLFIAQADEQSSNVLHHALMQAARCNDLQGRHH